MMQDFVQWVFANGQWNDGIVVLGVFMVSGLAYMIFSKE
jgi:hypothetical protein